MLSNITTGERVIAMPLYTLGEQVVHSQNQNLCQPDSIVLDW